MDVGLLEEEINLDARRHTGGETPQIAHQTVSLAGRERERRQVHRRSGDEHVQHGQPRLVPAGDRRGVIEGVLGDIRAIDRAEYMCNSRYGPRLSQGEMRFCGTTARCQKIRRPTLPLDPARDDTATPPTRRYLSPGVPSGPQSKSTSRHRS